MTTLPITLTIAGAAALLNVWLGLRISRLRRLYKVSIGHGGKPLLATRTRAHANFIEYTPLFLILLALIELSRGSETWLWVAAILFILARLAHPFGMDRPGGNAFRVGGVIVTWTVLLGLAGYAMAIPYMERAHRSGTTYASSSFSGGTKLS